ncbi:hypothetical protein KR084_005287 [Drosophila pseudotakahashii]|nr:hypothetical protein KR084_005287 [Drosophila pseudotakahashii]
MLKSAVALLFALIALQSPGALAVENSLQTTSSQCQGPCFNVLAPLVKHLSYHQDQWNATELIKANDVLARQDLIESQQKRMDGQMIYLLGNQSKVENLLNSQQTDSRNRQQILMTRQSDLETQLAALRKTVDWHEFRLNYPKFKQIGSRFFYIEQDTKQYWSAASNTCREMGGYLASIKDYTELRQISKHLWKNTWYWIGINDMAKTGEYISSATGRIAPLLSWGPDYPDSGSSYKGLYLYNGLMYNYPCNSSNRFICQADNTI